MPKVALAPAEMGYVPRRTEDAADHPADEGLSLVEVLVSLAVLTVVLTSLTVFLVDSRHAGRHSWSQNAAVQLLVDGMERARAVRGSALLSGRAACGSCGTVVSGAASTLLGAGAQRWDAVGGGTLTVPQPGTQPDGSVVDDPGDPEVVLLEGQSYFRYYHLAACRQPAVTALATSLSCTATASDPAQLVRLVVVVTWRGTNCTDDSCSYADAALFSTAVADPYIIG